MTIAHEAENSPDHPCCVCSPPATDGGLTPLEAELEQSKTRHRKSRSSKTTRNHSYVKIDRSVKRVTAALARRGGEYEIVDGAHLRDWLDTVLSDQPVGWCLADVDSIALAELLDLGLIRKV